MKLCTYSKDWGCDAEATMPGIVGLEPAYCKHHAVLFVYLIEDRISLGMHDELAPLPKPEMMRKLGEMAERWKRLKAEAKK